VSLSWNADAVTTNSATNTTGYTLHTGLSSGNYTQTQNAGSATAATVSQLSSGTTYYFVVTAYNAAGVQSAASAEVAVIAP
jgi:Fibronectin type III domain